jgi:signal transduction histidine kinase
MAASGIALVWDVELLQVENHLDAHSMSHLQFMLYEALSNAVQHAKAKVLRIEAHAQHYDQGPTRQGVTIRVVDDGLGFDVKTTPRNGLASMHERATAIGAQLSIKSQPGCTVVQIQLAYNATPSSPFHEVEKRQAHLL